MTLGCWDVVYFLTLYIILGINKAASSTRSLAEFMIESGYYLNEPKILMGKINKRDLNDL